MSTDVMARYSVGYRYVDPSRAGPFRGRMVLPVKSAKGDVIYAIFGRAVVTSCVKMTKGKKP